MAASSFGDTPRAHIPTYTHTFSAHTQGRTGERDPALATSRVGAEVDAVVTSDAGPPLVEPGVLGGKPLDHCRAVVLQPGQQLLTLRRLVRVLRLVLVKVGLHPDLHGEKGGGGAMGKRRGGPRKGRAAHATDQKKKKPSTDLKGGFGNVLDCVAPRRALGQRLLLPLGLLKCHRRARVSARQHQST